MKIAVITAVYGGVDDVQKPHSQETEHDVTFCIFGKTAEGWVRQPAEFAAHVPNVYRARSIKTCPHAFLKDKYDAYIWIDGCVAISGSGFVQSLADLLGDKVCGFYHCNTNKNLKTHEVTIGHMPLFKVFPLKQQIAAYLAAGYKDTVLYETGVHIKRNEPSINALGCEWLSHLFLWTYRDQFSLPFLLWKHGIDPAILGPSVWSTENHKHHGHTPEYARVRHRGPDGADSWTPGDDPNAIHPAVPYEADVPADSGSEQPTT